ncbi:hypothetical protein Pla100_08440 [Neorhodopirellula pilleata]|uniref:Uncharacterized protein n=1 Tax=Neorhodopirellula pilleata TaxID=2714738 RepID=A0A5C6AXL6_9BACT|nr:hypothetical protein Pla100_08440 [Neorhodopirellula pilleata]
MAWIPSGWLMTILPGNGFDVWEADGGVRTHFGLVLQFWQDKYRVNNKWHRLLVFLCSSIFG